MQWSQDIDKSQNALLTPEESSLSSGSGNYKPPDWVDESATSGGGGGEEEDP